MPRRNPNTFMAHTQVMTNAIAALRDTSMIDHIGIWLSALATSAAITFFAYIIARDTICTEHSIDPSCPNSANNLSITQ